MIKKKDLVEIHQFLTKTSFNDQIYTLMLYSLMIIFIL